jgi:hypothetical protein
MSSWNQGPRMRLTRKRFDTTVDLRKPFDVFLRADMTCVLQGNSHWRPSVALLAQDVESVSLTVLTPISLQD